MSKNKSPRHAVSWMKDFVEEVEPQLEKLAHLPFPQWVKQQVRKGLAELGIRANESDTASGRPRAPKTASLELEGQGRVPGVGRYCHLAKDAAAGNLHPLCGSMDEHPVSPDVALITCPDCVALVVARQPAPKERKAFKLDSGLRGEEAMVKQAGSYQDPEPTGEMSVTLEHSDESVSPEAKATLAELEASLNGEKEEEPPF